MFSANNQQASSSVNPDSSILYCSDVDETLKSSNPEKLVLNDNLIEKLKASGVKRLIFLTKMDAKNYNLFSPLRLPLIERLAKDNMIVDRVLILLDLLFRDAGYPDFHPGDTYEKFIKPVEQKLMAIKNIPGCAAHIKYNESIRTLNALNYLKDNCFNCSGETPLSSITQIFLQVDQNEPNVIEQSINNDYEKTDHHSFIHSRVDYNCIFDDLRNLLNHYEKNIGTLDALIGKLKANLDEEKTRLPEINSDDIEKIGAYYQELTIYRNRLYHANYTLIKKKIPCPEQTKGGVYAWYFEENPLDENAMVVFIDDSKKELDSVVEHHESKQFKHQLKVSLPPKGRTTREFDALGIDPEIFDEFIDGCHVPRVLKKILNGYTVDDELRNNYSKNLNSKGVNLAEAGDRIAAITYFQLAYLFCKLNPSTTAEQSHKENIISNIKLAKSQSKNDKPTDNSVIADEILLDIRKNCGFELTLQEVNLALDIHKTNKPSIYDKLLNATLLNFFSKKQTSIDEDFKEKIIDTIKSLSSVYPEKRERCVTFLDNLKEQFSPGVYTQAIDNTIAYILQNQYNQPNLVGAP